MSVHPLPVAGASAGVLSCPWATLEADLIDRQAEVESWLRMRWCETPAPFYASVDLRNAGFKLAPVDTNLFPAGFNNLNPAFSSLCVQAIQVALERVQPTAQRVLLVPESHTRNLYYLESLATLAALLRQAGPEVRIGSLRTDLEGPTKVELQSGRTLTLEPLVRDGARVGVADFDPCLVLLNNDLSEGTPPILADIEQLVLPPLGLGWSRRSKSGHFSQFQAVAEDFAAHLGLDPWLIDPLFRNCGEIDFMRREGEDCLAHNVEVLLAEIRRKYDEYGVTQDPFVFVKADSGSYGMGVMAVHRPDEIYGLNRRQRTRMAATKAGRSVTAVILQEGVYTLETVAGAVAEPVLYMIDHSVVGGFYRVHTDRGTNENLNAPGMAFEPLAFGESCITPDTALAADAEPNRYYAYGVVARLALLAAAREMGEVE